MLRFVELFAGAGSWHLAIQPFLNHQEQTVLVYEPNKVALRVFKDNLSNSSECEHTCFTDKQEDVMSCKEVDFCVASINAKDIYLKSNQALKQAQGSDAHVHAQAHAHAIVHAADAAAANAYAATAVDSAADHSQVQVNQAHPVPGRNSDSEQVSDSYSLCDYEENSSCGILLRFCQHAQPKVVLIETSSNLLNFNQGIRLIKLEHELKSLGYVCTSKIMNNKDFGVPHNKNRLYILAVKSNIDFGFNSFEFPRAWGKKVCLSDILEKDPVEQKYFLSSDYWWHLTQNKLCQKIKGCNFGMALADINGCANAIVKGSMGLERNLVVDDRGYKECNVDKRVHSFNSGCVRKLTEREYARLQGYPEKFNFTCTRSHTYSLVATSVCIPVVNSIFRAIFNMICKNYGYYINKSALAQAPLKMTEAASAPMQSSKIEVLPGSATLTNANINYECDQSALSFFHRCLAYSKELYYPKFDFNNYLTCAA